MSNDPILDAILGDLAEEEVTWEKPEFNARYGEGTHDGAVLQEVTPRENTITVDGEEVTRQSWMFKVDLSEGKPLTFFKDFPVANGDAERYEREVNNLWSLIHATGYLVTFKPNGKVQEKGRNTLDSNYEKLTAFFQHHVGQPFPIKVSYTQSKKDPEKLYKNVYGRNPKARG